MHKLLLQIFEENPYLTGAKSRFYSNGAFDLPTLSNTLFNFIQHLVVQPVPKDRHDDEHLGCLIRGCGLFLQSLIQLQIRLSKSD